MLAARRRLLLALCGGLLVALAIGAAVVAGRERADSRIVLHEEIPTAPGETSLLEAWDTAERTLEGWGSGWAITAFYSTDVHDVPGPASGSGGVRRTWQAESVGPSGDIRWLRITGGVAVDAIEPGFESASARAVALQRPAVDSPEALRLALELRPGFSPGSDKAIGFHFSLSLDAESQRALLVVLGSTGGEPARILLEPETDTFVRAERLVIQGGGVSVSRDAGQTWHGSPLSGFVSGIAGDDAAGGHTGPAYAAAWSGDSLGLWRTADEGLSWARVAVLPASAGDVAHALAVGPVDGGLSVVVSTNGGLWSFDIASGTTTELQSPGLVLDLRFDRSGELHATAMRPRDPDSARHYIRVGSAAWQLAGEGRATRLGPGASVAAIDGTGDVPGVPRWLAFDDNGQRGLRVTEAGAEMSSDGGRTWQVALPGAVSSVAIAPGFAESGVALAALFPDVIMRSGDGGATWKATGAFSSRAGGEVFFTGRTVAFMTNGGGAEWRDF